VQGMLDSYSRSPGPQRLRSCKVAKTEARMKLCIEDLVRKVPLWGYLCQARCQRTKDINRLWDCRAHLKLHKYSRNELNSHPSTLPAELQLRLLPFLDCQSLRKFEQTSKHFRTLPADSARKAVIWDILLALESEHTGGNSVLCGAWPLSLLSLPPHSPSQRPLMCN
jgi:hypothetical protein